MLPTNASMTIDFVPPNVLDLSVPLVRRHSAGALRNDLHTGHPQSAGNVNVPAP